LDEGDGPNEPIGGAESTAGVIEASGSGAGSGGAVVDSGIETAQGGTGGTAQEGGSGGTMTNADASRGDSSINNAGVGGQAGGAAGVQVDSAVPAVDASVAEGGVQPPLGTGSCCEEHTEPGCDNAETQACVCEKLPDCCTATWDLPCTLIVLQKFCEPGVRECVCGPAAEGGWEQTQCCETEWTGFCDETAVIKCGAKAGC